MNRLDHDQCRQLLESLGQGILRIDLQARVTYANDAALALTGYSWNDLLGTELGDLVPESIQAAVIKALAGEGELPAFCGAIKLAGGQTKDVSLHWNLLHDSEGNRIGAVALLDDVSSGADSDLSLEESSFFPRLLIDHMPNQIFWKDRNGVYQGCNQAFAEVVGLKRPRDVIGMTDFDFTRDNKYAESYRRWDRQIITTGEGIRDLEEAYTTATGEEGHVLTSKIPIRNAQGGVIGLLGICVDVTERRRAENEMQRMQRLDQLGTVAGGIAHDFNNLLTGIFGNLELAKVNLPDDSLSAAYLSEAHSKIQVARQLTGQLLTFAKGGAPVLERVDTASLLRETVRFNLHGSTTQEELEIEDGLWPINADKGQIGQVLANFTINARQAMPQGGTLHVSACNLVGEAPRQHGYAVRISFRDEGAGIPSEIRDRIFDPYFTTKEDGHGLGLAIAHSIIKQHQGQISVRSTPQHGTTFLIDLPAFPTAGGNAVAIPKPFAQATSPLGQLHILLMDDEEAVRDVGAAMLETIGHRVQTVATGPEAIAAYQAAREEQHPFDVVIMDLTIRGGIGGKETVTELLAWDPSARVIVASGYASGSVMAQYRDYGFAGKLAKPFQKSELEQVIARVMGRSESPASAQK